MARTNVVKKGAVKVPNPVVVSTLPEVETPNLDYIAKVMEEDTKELASLKELAEGLASRGIAVEYKLQKMIEDLEKKLTK